MKLKIHFEFSKIDFTKEEIVQVLECAAAHVLHNENAGTIMIGGKDCVHWELMPKLFEE
ncbi:MAG: hypothetical protein WCX79_01170 [Candidatus Paceibacterota bacterium]|jgi:hypothetical protein